MISTQASDFVSDTASMKRLVITMEPGRAGFEMLSPEPSLKLNDWEIVLNPSRPLRADFWIVFGNARPVDRMFVAPENTLLIVLEPEEKKIYPKRHYRQFNYLVDTHEKSGHPRCELHAPCFDWHVGIDHNIKAYRYGYQHLSELSQSELRRNKISVVCSAACRTKGQIERLEFLDALKRLLGDRIDHYGRGFKPVGDKMDAIYGYRAHLVLENCSAPHYWTEKLSDAYLGWAYPFYYGCPNISAYFPKNTLCHIESLDAQKAANAISSFLDSDYTEGEGERVHIGRNLILDKYNPFPAWVNWVETRYDADGTPKWLTIRSHKAFRPFPMNWLFRLKSGAMGVPVGIE